MISRLILHNQLCESGAKRYIQLIPKSRDRMADNSITSTANQLTYTSWPHLKFFLWVHWLLPFVDCWSLGSNFAKTLIVHWCPLGGNSWKIPVYISIFLWRLGIPSNFLLLRSSRILTLNCVIVVIASKRSAPIEIGPSIIVRSWDTKFLLELMGGQMQAYPFF